VWVVLKEGRFRVGDRTLACTSTLAVDLCLPKHITADVNMYLDPVAK
jgi:hypothetical protein